MGPHEPPRFVEVCPQCHRPVDYSTSRLITDLCGHFKCRICLLQEVNGCINCLQNTPEDLSRTASTARTSVIVSPPNKPDRGTCEIIEQSRQRNILFPSEIVKRSTGNFYHLKRAFSERFFKEDQKVDKMCSTDNASFTELPDHITEKYFCNIHKHTFVKGLLKHHMTCNETKGDEETYECDKCERMFPNTSKLNRHVRIHLSKSKFQCDICKKMFRDNNALEVHKRTHTNEQYFSCEDCGLMFKHRFSFKRHLNKHRGDYAHVCTKTGCGKKFLTLAELSRHLVRHTQAKPFACNTCGVQYAFRRSLERHKSAVHSGVSSKCSYCDASFRRKDNLERHIKNLHAEIIKDEHSVK